MSILGALRTRLGLGLAKAAQTIGGAQVVSGYTRHVPRRGAAGTLKAYSESPILRAVVSKIAYMCAAQQWRVFVAGTEGEIEVPGHPLCRMLEAGNETMSGMQVRMALHSSQDLAGEAFAVMDRNAFDVPVRAWYVPPTWVRSVAMPGHPFFAFAPLNGGRHVTIDARDVLYIRDVDPMKPYERGTGIGMSLGDELNADEYAAKHVAASLFNKARPDVVVSGTKEAPLDKDDKDRIETLWRHRFGGPENTGKPFFSSGPISVTTLGHSFRELELTDLREYERNTIIHTFGVPPEILGIIENSNRATIDSAAHLMALTVLRPRLRLMKAAINQQVAHQYGEGIRCDFDDPVESDRDYELGVMKEAPPAAFSLDDWREQAGREPLPEDRGQVYSVPLSDTLVARAKTVTKEPLDIAAVLDAVEDEEMRSRLSEAMRGTVAEFGEDALVSVGSTISFDVSNPRVIEFLGDKALERSKLIGGTTREALRKTLTEGVRDGESTGKLVKRIRETFTSATRSRAKLIARTEIVRASNFGVVEAHAQSGVKEQQWLATADAKVRDSHDFLDGQVVEVGAPFTAGGRSAMYPGDFGDPAEDCNCRCAVIAVPDREIESRTAIWKLFDGRRERHERQAERAAKSAFAAQEQATVEALEAV